MRNRGQTWLSALLSLGATACIGGQSGGIVEDSDPVAEGASAAVCECIGASDAVALRGTVESLNACGAAVRVEQVLAGHHRQRVYSGDLLEGQPANCPQQRGLQPGDPVFVLYSRVPGSADPSRIFLSALGARIRFGGTEQDLPLPGSATLDILLDGEACVAWADAHKPLPEEGFVLDGLPGSDGLMPVRPDPAASGGFAPGDPEQADPGEPNPEGEGEGEGVVDDPVDCAPPQERDTDGERAR